MAARTYFRTHGRRRVELNATLFVRPQRLPPGESRAATAHGVRIRNLGLGGACLELGAPDGAGAASAPVLQDLDPVQTETVVTLEVTAPTLWDPLTLRGKVAWLRRGARGRPTRAGIRFEHREATALYALFQLLGAHAFDV